MKRKRYLVLSLFTAGLLILLLVITIGAESPTSVEGIIIKVPADYPTIQAAVDAATDGDTILVAGSTEPYTENLTITKGITLSGGWDPAFSTRQPGDSIIDGQGLGRVISITCALSNTIVTIDGFTIVNGDASGLGMPMVAAHSIEALPSSGYDFSDNQNSDHRSPSAQMVELRAQLSNLEEQGLYPGGEQALQRILDRLEWRTMQAEDAKNRAEIRSVLPLEINQQGPGAGGGIYSHHTSPHLLNNVVKYNVATRSGQGLGGGIFIDQAPASAVIVANNQIVFNFASLEGEGRGGGLHITQAPGAHISGNKIEANVASEYGNGFGGGAYVHRSPGVIVEENLFFENAAADGDGLSQYSGVGGGLMIYDSQEAIVRDNQVERNTANAAWNSYAGAGGGMFLTVVNGAEVTDNLLRDNLAAIDAGPQGGGLQLQYTENALLADNEVTGNWAGMFVPPGEMGGGGMALVDVYSSTVRDNTITGNTASVVGGINALGGGLYGIKLFENTQIINNVIAGNLACNARCGFGGGGGAYVGDSYNVEVAKNTIVNNMAGLQDAPGRAGGLMMRNTSDSLVLRNRIQNNTGGIVDTSTGGGLVWDSFFGWSENITVDGNLILDNQASPNPAAMADGGGVTLWALRGDVQLSNNVVAGNRANQGGGMMVSDLFGGATLVNNTIADNGDIGLFVAPGVSTTVTVTNNILVNHAVGISITDGSAAMVNYTLWDGNGLEIGGGGAFTETHPIHGDPSFLDEAGFNYHLTTGSAAVDTGDPAGVPPAPDHDLDGVIRPLGTAVDIGAYEWQGHWQFLPSILKPIDSRSGWAIGHDETGTAAIAHTADGGLTWEEQGNPDAWTGLIGNDISAVDDQTAWAALGSGPAETNGAILHTTDGGTTWISQTIPSGLAGGIKSIKGLSRNEAWAASLGGEVLHTTDGGTTWDIVPHPTVPITQVNRMDAMGSHVWIADASDTGAVVHTQDGGSTWRAEFLPHDDSPLTVHAFDPLAVWASGSILPEKNPSFYRTVDGGDHWNFVQQIGANDHLDDICAASPDDVWGAVNGDAVDGRIIRLHVEPDGTPVAKNVTPPEADGYTPGGVTCLDTEVAWVVADKGNLNDPAKPLGIIVHTTDGGESWVQQPAPIDIHFWKISFVGARR